MNKAICKHCWYEVAGSKGWSQNWDEPNSAWLCYHTREGKTDHRFPPIQENDQPPKDCVYILEQIVSDQ
jgi:hypothetical protein